MTTVEKFEIYLKKVKPTQKILIFLMPLILFGGILFMTVLPMQEEEIEMLDAQNSKLTTNIKRKSSKTVKKKIQKSKKELLALKEKVQRDHDSLSFLYARLTNLEILEFSEQQWAVTLDDILKKSLSLNIKIKHIKNSDSEAKKAQEKIVPKKYVEIKGSAKFSDALEYLNFIENRQFLVDIKNIQMSRSENLQDIDFVINFTIYGVNI